MEQDQPRQERLLKVIKMLSADTPTYSMKDIARRMGCSVSTVYRHKDALEKCGFDVDRASPGRYYISRFPKGFRDVRNLVYLTEEQARVLDCLVAGLECSSPMRRSLHEKLEGICRTDGYAPPVDASIDVAANVGVIREAADMRRKVILKGYSSNHSCTVSDRTVEPIAIGPGYIDLWAYDEEAGGCRTFRLDRIRRAEPTTDPWTHADRHDPQRRDRFGMSGGEPERIILDMGMKGRNLLMEEYPEAGRALRPRGRHRWVLDTLSCSPEAPARFVIGTADDVRVICGERLEAYIREFTLRHLGYYLR